MKKVLAISFLFIFLSANTAFGEVLKLPYLIHHYIEHVQEDNDLSVVDFLVKHYSGKIHHHHKGNNQDHKKLPFKSANNHFVHTVSTIAYPILPQSLSVISLQRITFQKQQDYSNSFLNNIWQPPRIS